MIRNSRKLSEQLSLAFMLMAAPIFILALGSLFLQSRYLIHQEVRACSNSILKTTQYRVRSYMGTIETAANSNAWMMEANFRPDSLQSVLNRIVRLNPPVISSSVFAVPDMFKAYGHGFSLYTVNRDNTVTTYCEPDYNYFDKSCYTRPINEGHACWIDPYIDNAGGDVDPDVAIATYCRPLRLSDGRVVGVLTADFSFSRMAMRLNDDERPYPHAFFMLLGGDGRYLMHPDSTRLFRKTIFTDADPAKDQDMITLGHEMTAGKQGFMHVHSNGKLYHVCYSPISGTNWSLAFVCPDSEAMKSYYGLGYVIATLLVLGLLAILVLCRHMVRHTISPINRLIDTTQKMVDGAYDESIPVSRHEDVISQLQNSFSKMQQSLNERMGSLRQHADETRHHNEELSRAKQQAEDTVSGKNRFIQHMTQQMRMPLNVIMGFSGVLGESSTDKSTIGNEELGSITSMMKSNAISMNRMVLMLFDATETDAKGNLLCTRTDELSCNTVSRDVIDHIHRHFPYVHIHFETELQDGIHILTNRIYLLSVLIEPLYNAVIHSDGQHITLHVGQTATTVNFTIQDVGPGLPAELPDLTYKPFVKKDALPIGTGIGLPLAKRYAHSLGGSLIIDTDYHDGCRIVIEMPR